MFCIELKTTVISVAHEQNEWFKLLLNDAPSGLKANFKSIQRKQTASYYNVQYNDCNIMAPYGIESFTGLRCCGLNSTYVVLSIQTASLYESEGMICFCVLLTCWSTDFIILGSQPLGVLPFLRIKLFEAVILTQLYKHKIPTLSKWIIMVFI